MNNIIKKSLFSLCCLSTLAFSSDVLAVLNGHKITTDVAPKNFKTMDRSIQDKIVARLIEKRLASDYALHTSIVKTKEYQKTLKHVLMMNDETKPKEKDSKFLVNVLKDDAKIKGFTAEQLYSKKGLLAFDFLVNKEAEKIQKNLTNAELKEYYESHKYKYDTPALKELLTIVVNSDAKAKDIIAKVSSSANTTKTFMDMATKYSLAPSAQYGGYFGKIATKELNSKIKPYIKDLKSKEYTKTPIKTEFGYQLFYVLNDIAQFNSTFSEVKSKVEYELTQQKVKQWAMDIINNLKAKAKIKIPKS